MPRSNAYPSARPSAPSSTSRSTRVASARVGDIEQEARRRQVQPRRSSLGRTVAIVVCVVAIAAIVGLVSLFALARSGLFTVEEVSVVGVEHLTATDMALLADVPEGTSLLDVDTAGIEQRLLADAWVESVSVNRVFPNKLEIVVTERTIEAVVQVPTGEDQSIRTWAIASDGMWLMPIPDRNSEAGQATSEQVYEDAANALLITGVPYGLKPEIGTYNTDENVANALAIVSGMTTDLADQVKTVTATDPESTTLTLDNGVEIAFGSAEDIRAKERVCLELLEEHAGSIAYINVRVVERPTWRAL